MSLRAAAGYAAAMAALEKPLFAAFVDELQKIAVSEEEALDAAKLLSQDPRSRVRKYVDAGAVGAVLNPAVDTTGHFVKGFVDTNGGLKARLAGGASEIGKKMTLGEAARGVHRGLFGGMAVQAGREGFQLHRAQDTYQRFMREHGGGG